MLNCYSFLLISQPEDFPQNVIEWFPLAADDEWEEDEDPLEEEESDGDEVQEMQVPGNDVNTDNVEMEAVQRDGSDETEGSFHSADTNTMECAQEYSTGLLDEIEIPYEA